MRKTKMHANILSQLVPNKKGEKSWTSAGSNVELYKAAM